MKITEKQLSNLIKEAIDNEINGKEEVLNEEEASESAEENKEEENEQKENSDNNEAQEEMQEPGLHGTALKLLGRLEGIHVTLKELHWGAERMAEHTLLDTIDGEVLELLDEVAEVSMGLLDEKFGKGDLKAEECTCSDCAEVLTRLVEVIIETKSALGESSEFAGLQSILDDFLGKVNKWNYLRKLT